MSGPIIRKAKPGDESAIHEAHMRSIREICVRDHGEEEVRGWGNRPLEDRWIHPIRDGYVWVVERGNEIHGHAYIKITDTSDMHRAHIFGLYLTPDILHQGLGLRLANLMLE